MTDIKKTTNKPEEITDKDLRKAWFRWWTFAEVSHSFERMQAVAFCNAIMPILKKLYKEKEELKAALKRHLLFFNTQATWGGSVTLGAFIALEEQRAKAMAEGDSESLDPDVITSTKVGLMGPLAGIGDSLEWGTFRYIVLALAIPWASEGMWIAGFLPWLIFVIATYSYGYFFFKTSYRLGRGAALKMLESGVVQKIIDGTSVLGMVMMGVLAANYIKVSAALQWTLNEQQFTLQSLFDKILPGILDRKS
ncbi:MAG: PTS system mannose/fructose/sorbose family transporter subunit IID, partial [Tepidanaerobacteraceae bacterium]|nr:PTS system mannose/fructose/sorbose family transporter subunit IID [Tepidanaerobacteraceae bacterium]